MILPGDGVDLILPELVAKKYATIAILAVILKAVSCNSGQSPPDVVYYIDRRSFSVTALLAVLGVGRCSRRHAHTSDGECRVAGSTPYNVQGADPHMAPKRHSQVACGLADRADSQLLQVALLEGLHLLATKLRSSSLRNKERRGLLA